MMRCGGRPAISCPRKRIEPAVGAKVPDSMLKIVLFPDPFGPIRPRISPSPTANETSLTAVKPPNRLKSPVTSSTERRSLHRVRRAGRQFQHRLLLLLCLWPYDIALVIDVLHDHRVGALVLSGHRGARGRELDAEAEHRRAVRQIGVERRLAQIVGGSTAVLLDRAGQDIG